MYGAQHPRTEVEIKPLSYRRGKNSEVFTKGDILEYESGFLNVVDGATDRPVGICDTTVTMSSTNQTVAKVDVAFLAVTDDLTFEMDFDAASGAEADHGAYFTLTGTTGAMLVSYASKSATVGQVVLVKLDPRNDGSAVRGEFKFAKTIDAYVATT